MVKLAYIASKIPSLGKSKAKFPNKVISIAPSSPPTPVMPSPKPTIVPVFNNPPNTVVKTAGTVPEAKGIIAPLPSTPGGPSGPIGPCGPVAPGKPCGPLGPGQHGHCHG